MILRSFSELMRAYARAGRGDRPAPYRAQVAELVQVLDDRHRRAFTGSFSFGVPCREVVDRLAALAPLVEIGAGTGFWARLVSNAGGQVVAVDQEGSNYYHRSSIGRWHPVDRLGYHPGLLRDGYTVLLCWPPVDDPLAAKVALDMGPGSRLVYVGEFLGCTADDDFHNLLFSDFTVEEQVLVPNWRRLDDVMLVLRKD